MKERKNLKLVETDTLGEQYICTLCENDCYPAGQIWIGITEDNEWDGDVFCHRPTQEELDEYMSDPDCDVNITMDEDVPFFKFEDLR